jgi:hypothetical protein
VTNLNTAHQQWASRPEDQRFLDLDSLQDFVDGVRDHASTRVTSFQKLEFDNDEQDILALVPDREPVVLTHYSFQQLCSQAQISAGELRKLPPKLAQSALEYRFQFGPRDDEETKLLLADNDAGIGTLRAANGVGYGRIWDSQVVNAVRRMNSDGRWTVPTPFRAAAHGLGASDFVVDKKSTTLYASDRDLFTFLVDERNPIDIGDQVYFRGFYAWNSEVGERTFGIAQFLYSYVCANRMIWGGRDFEEVSFRHTSLAPERFEADALPALKAIADSSPEPLIAAIKLAKETKVADKASQVQAWLEKKGFGKSRAAAAVGLAARGGDTGSSGDPTNLWDIVQGGTALAREIPNQNDRVQLEKDFSGLLGEAGKVIVIS